jgi:hypothetical protein
LRFNIERKTMKRIAASLMLVAMASGCAKVQGVTNKYADKVPGGRVILDKFREGEGASVGMEKLPDDAVRIVDYVDNNGTKLTNGVRAVTTIRYERSLVESAVAPVAVPVVDPVTNAPNNADLLNKL